MRNKLPAYFGDFKCIQCRNHVSADTILSGVKNRNHCPYCLHSRHVDLHEAGDRLSACKGTMQPVGLALKKTWKKYGTAMGELMLIHRCTDCSKLSINRIAADDIPEHVYEVFARSHQLDQKERGNLHENNIQVLLPEDDEIVRARLFGWGRSSLAEQAWIMSDYPLAR